MTEEAGIPPRCEIEIRLASGAEGRASGVVQARTNGRVRTGSGRGGGHPGGPCTSACYRAKNAGPRDYLGGKGVLHKCRAGGVDRQLSKIAWRFPARSPTRSPPL